MPKAQLVWNEISRTDSDQSRYSLQKYGANIERRQKSRQ